MIQTTLIPEGNTVQINIPNNYIGKKVHALVYIDEEITEAFTPAISPKPSDFFGTLSLEESVKMHAHTIETRKEWNRDIYEIPMRLWTKNI